MERLDRLIRMSGARDAREREALEAELEHAEIVASDKIPPDVVTMNSHVRFIDEDSGDATEVTLVYPGDADVDAGRVSVLAPIGAALLGLTVGDSIAWPLPDGRTKRLLVAAVTYQPEASGDLHL